MSLPDILLGIEVFLFVFVGLPLSIRGTFRLIAAVRVSTPSDRLARAITIYLALVSATAVYLLLATAYRVFASAEAVEWLRPVSGLLLLGVMVGPWWIERATRTE